MSATLILTPLFFQEEKQLSKSSNIQLVTPNINAPISMQNIQPNPTQNYSFFLEYFFNKIYVDDEEYGISPEIEIKIKFDEIESEIGLKVVKVKIPFGEDVEEYYFEMAKDTKIYGYLFPYQGKTLDIITNETIFNSKIEYKKNKSNVDLKINPNF